MRRVFISYSHIDKRWLERLQVHLKPLHRDSVLDLWDDTRIAPGSRWRDEIQQALAETTVAILLISADFLASDFIATVELPTLLAQAESKGAIILPLIIGPSRFEDIESFASFQTVNSPSQPLMSMPRSRQEQILADLSRH